MRLRSVSISTIVLAAAALGAPQTPTPPQNPLLRHYRAGETLVYQMTGTNESWHYTIRAEGVVGKDDSGAFIEEYRWKDLVSDGKPAALTPETDSFRQRLSLDPGVNPSVPDLTRVDPRLIGPITDFMTFYADLWLAVKTGQMTKPGDHFYFKMGMPSSWADGSRVLVGASSIDFDFTLKTMNAADETATLVVRHVPPDTPHIPLPAPWMQAPVADTANNWVQVAKQPDGKFIGSAGQETFTVDLTVSLADGKILAASMDNTVKTVARTCEDQPLTHCSAPQPHTIVRKIEIALVPAKP